jgi:hypothetical protein
MIKHYLCTVCVKLHKHQQFEDGPATVKVVGYYRNFGVGASSESTARSMVSQSANDGEIDWNDSSCKEIDLKSFDKEISAHCKDPTQETIWYRSGCSFFPEEIIENN